MELCTERYNWLFAYLHIKVKVTVPSYTCMPAKRLQRNVAHAHMGRPLQALTWLWIKIIDSQMDRISKSCECIGTTFYLSYILSESQIHWIIIIFLGIVILVVHNL